MSCPVRRRTRARGVLVLTAVPAFTNTQEESQAFRPFTSVDRGGEAQRPTFIDSSGALFAYMTWVRWVRHRNDLWRSPPCQGGGAFCLQYLKPFKKTAWPPCVFVAVYPLVVQNDPVKGSGNQPSPFLPSLTRAHPGAPEFSSFLVLSLGGRGDRPCSAHVTGIST